MQAQTSPTFTSEYDLVNKELLNTLYGNCSSVGYECLENFTIKDTLYITATIFCNTYNNQNNMDSATVNGNTTSYVYNAFNERVAKNNSTVNKNFIYDNNQIIGEYEGLDFAEYIYFGNTPIALHKNGQLYFIHTDHLDTPRAITNNVGSTVWKWDNIDPFGKNAPTNLGIDFNLRFSGQYSDSETGLFYNYFRYYNPIIGRYIQPDPIGLAGGFDLYAYVGQNPINFVDPLGLKADLNFFGIQEPQYWRAMKYNEQKDWFSVAGHGNAIGGIYDKGLYSSYFFKKNVTMVSVPVEKLAQYIKAHPRYKQGMGVDLLGCEIGVILHKEEQHKQYAQKLSNILNATVRAPNKFIWYHADGKTSINSSYMLNGKELLNEKDPGKLNVFYPNK